MASSSSSETSMVGCGFISMLFKLLQGLLELVARHPRAGADLGVGVPEAGRQGGSTGDRDHDQTFPFDLGYRSNDDPAPGSKAGQDLGLGQRRIDDVGV